MTEGYTDLQGGSTDVVDHPTHNFSDRVQLAGDTLPINPTPLADMGKKTYNLELRRSPGDGTYRKPGAMNDNWDQFKSPTNK